MKRMNIELKTSHYLPHLNVQTNSNLSFSLIKISELVNWAKEQKLEYLAIADYYPYDLLKFYDLCKAQKIKPIIGIKVIIKEGEKQYLLTIYPQNSTGYKDLIRKVFSSEAPEDRIFLLGELLPLQKNCLLVFVAHNLEDIKYFSQQPFFSSEKATNFYIGFDFYIKEPKKNISQKILLSLLPFFSVKSLSAEEDNFLALLRESFLKQHFLPTDLQQKSFLYLKEEELMNACTNDKVFARVLSSQIQNFLSQINLKFSFSSQQKGAGEKERKSFTDLQDKCFKQLLFLQKEPREKYEKRLEEELQVINKLNYSHYFLIFNNVVEYLKKIDVTVGPGRGSAVSSLVAYLLGITKIDPLEHNLLFERFLNEKRQNPPDIDIDVENQEVIWDYLQEKYGEKKFARIATRQKVGWKNALKECAEIVRQKKIRPVISETDLKEIINLVKEESLQENLKTKFFQNKYQFLFAISNQVKELFFNTSLHPSGVIISEKEFLTKLIPLRKEKKYLVSYYPEENFNTLGLKKYDFLSLNSLRLLSEVKKILQKESLPKCNFQDKETWKLISNCLVTDIPQLDTTSFRKLLLDFQPKKFNELVLLLALNRPGARQNMEMIWQQRQKAQTKFFTSPILNQILQESYGFVVFEEQISQIFAFVNDCSFAEAEIKRRNLSKSKKDELEVTKKNFLENSAKKIPVSEGKKLWEQIISNNAYTFNKAHAVAYSYLCYYIAYLKANYFSSLITYYLDNSSNSSEKTLLYFQEAIFYGFSLQKPDINFSESQWIRKGKILIMGFNSLKNYHASFFTEISEERKKKPFRDWEDFLHRTNKSWKNIELSTFQKWIEVDLFSSLKINSNSLIKHKEVIFRYCQLKQNFPLSSRELPPLDWLTIGSAEKNDNSDTLLINQREKENLGVYVSYFKRWKQKKNELSDFSLTIWSEFISNLLKFDTQDNLLYIYAIIQDIQSKRDNIWLTLQDFRSTLKMIIISKEFYQKNQEILKIDQEIICQIFVKVINQKIRTIQIQQVKLI